MTRQLISCSQCPDASCCLDLTIEIDNPISLEDWDEIRWMTAHKNVSVVLGSDGNFAVVFNTPCEKLLSNGKCGIYSSRPETCARYPVESCQQNGDGDLYTLRFDKIEDVDVHIKEKILPLYFENNSET